MRYVDLAVRIAATALLGMATAPASADLIDVTVTGTVGSGIDGAGLFGAAGRDLTGVSYSTLFHIDTSKGKVTGGVTYIPDHGPISYASTLSNIGGAPAITGQLTIGSQNVFVDGSKYGVNDYEAQLHIDSNSLVQDVASADTELSMYDYYNPIYPVSPLDDPSEGIFHDPNLNPANFYYNLRGFGGEGDGAFTAVRSAGTTSLSLDLDTINYDVLSSVGGPTSFVPEAPTWAMFIAGFGLVGAATRRRQASRQAA